MMVLLFSIALFQGLAVQLQIYEYLRLKPKYMILSTWRSNLSFGFLLVSANSFIMLLEELQINKVISWEFLQNPIISYLIIPTFTGIFLGIAPTFYAYQAYKEKIKLIKDK